MTHSSSDNNGPVVIVTGAASGIGRATAQLLAGRGMRVVCTDLASEALTSSALECGGLALPADVTDEDQVEAMVAAAHEAGEPLTAHALYYPPANAGFAGPADELPPLLVMSHGGPTAAHETLLSMEIQFWTSRGVAVVDVNYGGSTGYGRTYRERLRGNWGIVDTVDCINAARYLAARGDVDPQRLAIQPHPVPLLVSRRAERVPIHPVAVGRCRQRRFHISVEIPGGRKQRRMRRVNRCC